MFLLSIKNLEARKWASVILLSWIVVFFALLYKLPFMVSVLSACISTYLHIRFAGWLCENEERLEFVNFLSKEHAFPSSAENDRAQFNFHIMGFLSFFCVPLVFAKLAMPSDFQTAEIAIALAAQIMGVFGVTGLIHTLVRRNLSNNT